MSLLWHNPTRYTIGIDVSDHIIRAVLVRHSRSKDVIRRFAQVPLPEGLIQNGTIIDAAAVRELLQQHIFKQIPAAAGTAVIGLPEAHGFIKTVVVREGRLREEIERHLPFPYEEVDVDSLQYGSEDLQPGSSLFGFAAMKRTITESYWQLFHSLGIHIRALEIESQALARLYTRHPVTDHQISILGDVGRNHTTFVVVQHGHIDFTHTSQMISGKLLTAAIVKQTGWTVEQAEEQKLAGGAHPVVHELMSRFGTVLAHEVQRVVDFHSEHQATRQGSEYVIYFTGGGSQIADLRPTLEASIQYPIQAAVVPKQVIVPKRMSPVLPSFGTAIGLGIRQYSPL